MKTKKSSLSILALLFLTTLIFAQKNPQKILVTTLNPNDAEKIVLDLEDRIEVQKWNNDYVAIYVEVSTNITHKNVVEQLVKNGRYEIEGFLNEKNNMMVKAPNLNKTVTVNSTPLEEEIKFKLYLPKCQDFALAERFQRDALAAAEFKRNH